MIQLPEFLRIQWVSAQAQEKWEPIINQITIAGFKAEVDSVSRGLRKVGFITTSPEDLRQITRETGLDVLVTDVGGSMEHYTVSLPQYRKGQPFNLRAVIGKQQWVDKFAQALRGGDDEAMGEMLGYPKCCVDNFIRLWREKKIRDFTWDIVGIQTNQKRCVVISWAESFPLWMKMSMRAYYHMPCSYRCYNTVDLAHVYTRDLWNGKVWNDFREILSWPVEWSALHGAAEIRTPIVKITHTAEYTPDERIIQFFGAAYPEEGARSDRFPYNLKTNDAYNNGFSDMETMIKCHEPILEAANSAIGVRSIYDPGCGNGLLLKSLAVTLETNTRGCDINEHAVIEGRLLDELVTIEHKNMFDVEHPSADMIVLMPGRLAEVPEDKARDYVARLNYRYMLLYVYQDHVENLWLWKDKFFPKTKLITSEVNEYTTALLLEKQ